MCMHSDAKRSTSTLMIIISRLMVEFFNFQHWEQLYIRVMNYLLIVIMKIKCDDNEELIIKLVIIIIVLCRK